MKDDALPTRGWENRALQDLGEFDSMTYCYPGFMGSICERLVAQGLASRQDAGLTEKPDNWPKRVKFNSHPQYRYTITDAGRQRLAEQQEDARDV